MKEFIIIYRNVQSGKTIEGLTNAKDMFGALLESKTLCIRLGNCGITLEVISISEVVKER